MKRRKACRRGFTLAELIMAIALLAIFSVFIVQMFAKSDQLAKKARNLDQAVACASNLADQWKMNTSADVPPQILDLRQNRQAGRSMNINLDSHFQICEPAQAYYQAVLTIQPGLAGTSGSAKKALAATPGLWQLTVVIGKLKPSDSAPIYTLQTSRYFPGEVAAP